LRDNRAIEPLAAALHDSLREVCEQAAFAIGQLRDPKAVEAVVVALKNANASIREWALGLFLDDRRLTKAQHRAAPAQTHPAGPPRARAPVVLRCARRGSQRYRGVPDSEKRHTLAGRRRR